MLRQIKTLVPLVLILCWTFQLAVPSKALAQQPTQAPQSQGELVAPDPEFEKPGEPPTAAPPAAQPAAQPPAGTATGPANQPGSTVQVPPAQRGQELSKEGGAFVIKRNVQEVTLHATVVDERQRIVTGLDQNAFQIFENGEPQKLTSFRREEVPVALGIVIDNSGTMRDKRPAVNQAALNLIKASNPEDQVFVVNFNQEPYLDQDYTGNVDLLREALERIESRGGTALYDAVVAAADHLMKTAKLEKKAILVVTDGDDNASRQSLEQAIRRIAVDGGPTVYSIGILGGEKQKRARRALRTLAEQTGGVSFFPNDLSEVDNISRQVAHDIRNQYVLQYAPTVAKAEGGYRTVKVEARAPGYKRLQVRTRTGYYANEQQRAAK
ncbi:MAG TPA: VWA domain-containing protein [Clostridia bacterium]|nr:VWA domain-containing protein [Clostridia bacterium]